jgi:hypothetical protein
MTTPRHLHDGHDRRDLDELLAGAAGTAPAWRSFTADAMHDVRRRAARRHAAERVVSVACAVFAIVFAATAVTALRPSGGDGDARTVRTADDPVGPSHEEQPAVVDGSTATTSTTRPSLSVDGRRPVHGEAEVGAKPGPAVTFPPPTTPSPAPAPTTTAPRMDESRPPTSFASLNGVEIQALQGPSCWKRGGRETCEEVRSDWLHDAPLLDGIQSGSLWFRWAIHEQPADVVARAYFPSPEARPETIRCEGGNPCRIDFGVLQVGTDPKWIVLETKWANGTVMHAVKVRSHPVE